MITTPSNQTYRKDFSGQPDFPKDASIDDITSEIITSEIKHNPSLKLVHQISLKRGRDVSKIATLFIIVDHETGEFKGYDLNIWSIIRKKNGYYFSTEERKFTLHDKQGEIKALRDFLNLVYLDKLPNEEGNKLLVNQEDFLMIEKIKILGLNNMVKSLFESGELTSKDILISSAKSLNILDEISRQDLLNVLKEQNLTKKDIDILLGRKESLKEFEDNLRKESDWDEKEWQSFFERNTWIFGYGLDYKFLRILQREAVVSISTTGGQESVTADFLLGSIDFTVLVEQKRPDTNLFSPSKNRSGSWCLSKDLIEAVSQILEQKAEWQVKSRLLGTERDKQGRKISQKTVDPKVILIIGHSNQYKGEELEFDIKSETFELFRRNQRNIDILTFDELFDRANFIISHH